MKHCWMCGRDLPESEFYCDRRRVGGLDNKCRSCSHTRAVAQANRRVGGGKEYADRVRAERGCQICGEKDPVVLDFHHTGDKSATIALLTDGRKRKGNITLSAIKAEIERCIVVCANCHRRIHAGTIKDLSL